jgi:hypothetical protein
MNILSISLRFRHPSQDLNYLSTLLDMPCSRSWLAGSSRQTPRGDKLPGIYDYSYWYTRLEFPAKNAFKEQIEGILNRLLSVKDALAGFRQSGGGTEIYIQFPGSVNNGDTIPSDILKIMGDLGVDLILEVFPNMTS